MFKPLAWYSTNDELLQALSSTLLTQLKNSESSFQVTYSKLYFHTHSLLERIAIIDHPPIDLMVSWTVNCKSG